MGQCYYVEARLRFPEGSEDEFCRLVRDEIRARDGISASFYELEKHDLSTPLGCFQAVTAGEYGTTDDGAWTAAFDGSYGWESVMTDIFMAAMAVLADGSEILIYPDEDLHRLIVKDGKVTDTWEELPFDDDEDCPDDYELLDEQGQLVVRSRPLGLPPDGTFEPRLDIVRDGMSCGRLTVSGVGVDLGGWAWGKSGRDASDLFPNEELIEGLREEYGSYYDRHPSSVAASRIVLDFNEDPLDEICERGYDRDLLDVGMTGIAGVILAAYPRASELTFVESVDGGHSLIPRPSKHHLILARDGEASDVDFLKEAFGPGWVCDIVATCEAGKVSRREDRDTSTLVHQGLLPDGLSHVFGIGVDIDGDWDMPSSWIAEAFPEGLSKRVEEEFVDRYSRRHFEKMGARWVLDRCFRAEDGSSGWAGVPGAVIEAFPEAGGLVFVRDTDGHRHAFARAGDDADAGLLRRVFGGGYVHLHDAVCEGVVADEDGNVSFPPMDHVPDDEREPTTSLIWTEDEEA